MTVISCPRCPEPSPLSVALGVVGMKKQTFADYYDAGADKHFNEGWEHAIEREPIALPDATGHDGAVNVLMYMIGMVAGSIGDAEQWMTPHCKTGECDTTPGALPVTGADTDVPEEVRGLIHEVIESGFASDEKGTVEHGGSYFAIVLMANAEPFESTSVLDEAAWGYEVNTYGQKAYYKFATNEDAREWLSAMEG